MKFNEIARSKSNDKVETTFEIGNLTIHLTSTFRNKVSLEDALYDIAIQRFVLKNKKKGVVAGMDFWIKMQYNIPRKVNHLAMLLLIFWRLL